MFRVSTDTKIIKNKISRKYMIDIKDRREENFELDEDLLLSPIVLKKQESA